MEKTLMNAIKNMVVYQDDICLGDITEKRLNPKTVFKRQRRAAMLMNWKYMFIIGNIASWRLFDFEGKYFTKPTFNTENIKWVRKQKNKKKIILFL